MPNIKIRYVVTAYGHSIDATFEDAILSVRTEHGTPEEVEAAALDLNRQASTITKRAARLRAIAEEMRKQTQEKQP